MNGEAVPVPMPSNIQPTPEPAKPAHEGAPPAGGMKTIFKVLIFLGLIVFGAGILYYLKVSTQRAAAPVPEVAVIQTAPVKRGNLERRIRVTGQTSARNFANLVAPRLRGPDSSLSLVLLKILPSGTMVKKGDIVAEFDPQSMQDHLDDTIDGLKDKENEVKKKQVQNELDMENLRQSLRQAKAELDKARLDAKATDVRTDIDRELLRLAVEENEAAYKELQADLPTEEISQKADLKITEINQKIDELHVERHREDLRRLKIRAPMDGMVVVQTMFRPGGDQVMLAVGDRIGPGQQIMKIIDPKTMQVEGTINQAESSHFRIGQNANVLLDAFPGAAFGGKVYAIGALAVSGGRQQYFIRNVPVRVQMLDLDKRVIPDLSASADVLLERAENVLTVPASAVVMDGGKSYVNVKTPQGFERRPVKIGITDGVQVVIEEGLSEGDVVRAS
jgi:HlyD family secretion protein